MISIVCLNIHHQEETCQPSAFATTLIHISPPPPTLLSHGPTWEPQAMARVHLKASYGAPEIKASHLGAPTIKTTIQQMWSTSRPKIQPARMFIQPVQPFSRLKQAAMVPPTILVSGSGFGGSITPHFITMAACTLILHPFYCESASWPETDGKKTFCGLRRGRLENGQLERRLETTPKTLELSTPTRTPRSNLSIPTPQRLHLSRKGMDRQPRRL
jgi:hypothetical protein